MTSIPSLSVRAQKPVVKFAGRTSKHRPVDPNNTLAVTIPNSSLQTRLKELLRFLQLLTGIGKTKHAEPLKCITGDNTPPSLDLSKPEDRAALQREMYDMFKEVMGDTLPFTIDEAFRTGKATTFNLSAQPMDNNNQVKVIGTLKDPTTKEIATSEFIVNREETPEYEKFGHIALAEYKIGGHTKMFYHAWLDDQGQEHYKYTMEMGDDEIRYEWPKPAPEAPSTAPES